MKTFELLMVTLLLTGAACAQIDNRYCTPQNTWVGTHAANPVIMDGPASLPVACFNTDSKNTPSPGPVVTVNATESLQTAYNAAACGTVIKLAHGATWNDPFTFPSKACDDQHWITIMSDGRLTPEGYRIAPSFIPEMAQLKIARNSGLISVGDHLRFVGIYWAKNTRNGGILYYFALMKDANKVIFDRNLFRGNPREETQHGIVTNTGKFIAVIDSWMDEFHCTTQTGCDSQAISGGTASDGSVLDSGPVKIVNNFLEASTENILFGGAQADGPGPSDVEIRRNYLYKPMSWNPGSPTYQGDPPYVTKNCLELKNGVRFLVEGNVCENVWGGFSQKGDAILLTPKNQAKAGTNGLCPLCMVADITIRYNYIHTASGAFLISSGMNGTGTKGQYSMGQHRTSIHDNVADDLQYGATCYGCGYMLMQLGSGYAADNPPPLGGVMNDVSINNNTILASGENPSNNKFQARALITVTGVPPNSGDTPQASNISFQNNIASTMDAGMYPTGGGSNNCAVVAKPQTPINMWTGCFVGNSPFSGNVLVEYPKPITNWPEGNLFSPTMATVGFYDYDGAVYGVPGDSPYLGKGANIDLVNLATWGVREQALEAPVKGKKPGLPYHPPIEPEPPPEHPGWGLTLFIAMVVGFGLGIFAALAYVLVKRPRRGVNS